MLFLHSPRIGILETTPRPVTGPLREVCPPVLPPVVLDAEVARRIRREETPCQPQQVVVVVPPFRISLLQDSTDGVHGLSAVIHAIDRYRSHRRLLFPRPATGGCRHSRVSDTIILPAGLRYRLFSGKQAALCPHFR